MLIRSHFLAPEGGDGGGVAEAPVSIETAIAAAKARFLTAPAAEGAPPAETPPAETPPEVTPEGTPPAETPPDETTEEGAAPATDEQADPGFILPPLAAGEEAIPLEIQDPVIKARLETLTQYAEQVQAVGRREQEILAQQREMEEFEDALVTDPMLVVLEHMAPEVQADVVLGVLLQPGVWAELKPVLMQLDDPRNAQVLAANLTRRMAEVKPVLAARQAERATIRKSNQVVTAGVARIAEELPKAKQLAFTEAAYKAVVAYNRRTKNNQVTTRDLPLLLNEVLAAHGVDPLQAVARLSGTKVSGAKRADPPKPTAIGRKITTPAEALAQQKSREAAAAAGAQSSVVPPKAPGALEAALKDTPKGDLKGLFKTIRSAVGRSA